MVGSLRIALVALLLGGLGTPWAEDRVDFAAVIGVPETGQSQCFEAIFPAAVIDCAGTGQDGEFRKGYSSPAPRFVDHGDGTRAIG